MKKNKFMLELVRKKDHRWILQKNVSSRDIITSFLEVASKNKVIDYENIKNKLKINDIYKGRSTDGSSNTMGVRFSQMCFYMFGYKDDKYFFPSPMSSNLLNPNSKISKEQNFLINLFSMQYPNPYSETKQEFDIYSGRLIIKLLLDTRIECKLYIDEIIWFLPFIEKINFDIYEELIGSILEYRELNYFQKKKLFESVENYNDVFSNVLHEFNYYFLRMFDGFGVFIIKPDINHNGARVFKFKHGNGETYRNDAYKSRKVISGYVTLSDSLKTDAAKLIEKFSPFEEPTKLSSPKILSRKEFLTILYETEPLEYLNCISIENSRLKDILEAVNNMLHASKYGSKDGKEFENSLEPFMHLFREISNVEIISGSGNTDLLFVMQDGKTNETHKINLDAKTRKNSLNDINPSRIEKHLRKTGSEFCIIVAPRFASGTSEDIKGHNIVTINAENLGSYCYQECKSNSDGYADFSSIYDIAKNNLGSNISIKVQKLMFERYGIEC